MNYLSCPLKSRGTAAITKSWLLVLLWVTLLRHVSPFLKTIAVVTPDRSEAIASAAGRSIMRRCVTTNSPTTQNSNLESVNESQEHELIHLGRRKFLTATLVTISAHSIPLRSSVAAETDRAPSVANTFPNWNEQTLQQNLHPATIDRPQISLFPQSKTGATVLPPNDNIQWRDDADELIAEGMISLARPEKFQSLLSASSTIYVTVRVLSLDSTTSPLQSPIVAGARVPVSQVHFPFRFRLSTANILLDDSPQQFKLLRQSLLQSDLLVEATVCGSNENHQESAGNAMDCGKQVLQAQCVAKLLQLKDPDSSMELSIRAPVTLSLQ
jgi:hypothetical protein